MKKKIIILRCKREREFEPFLQYLAILGYCWSDSHFIHNVSTCHLSFMLCPWLRHCNVKVMHVYRHPCTFPEGMMQYLSQTQKWAAVIHITLAVIAWFLACNCSILGHWLLSAWSLYPAVECLECSSTAVHIQRDTLLYLQCSKTKVFVTIFSCRWVFNLLCEWFLLKHYYFAIYFETKFSIIEIV